MAVFDELDWGRPDVAAIVTNGGLLTVASADYDGYRTWLAREAYTVDRLDGSAGLAETIAALGRLLRWDEQFGYTLAAQPRNLDALRDGFHFDVPQQGGHVLELRQADLLWNEDADYVRGLLAIACEHSRCQLALGRRFFTALIVPGDADFLGERVDTLCVPWPWRG